MAVRSAAAMVIPMLEFQAQQFLPQGLHHLKIDAERNMYAEIQRRLAELNENLDMKEEGTDAQYVGTSSFANATAGLGGNRHGTLPGNVYSPGESYGFSHLNPANAAMNQQHGEYEDSNDEEEEYSSEEELTSGVRGLGNIYS